MNKHRQRILDFRFQALMVAKAKSDDPHEAAIGRQGQALRASCILSKPKRASLMSNSSSEASSLQRDLSPLARRDTELTEPDVGEEIQKVLEGVPKWAPGSFGRNPDSKDAPTYNNILGTSSIRRGFPKPKPTECELSNHEANMRLFGGTYWFNAPDPDRIPQSFNELPLEEQKRRIRELREPNLFLHFPKWDKPKCRGVGRYRMSVDLSPDEVVHGLVDRMGPIADCLGLAGSLQLDGFDGIQLDSLLCVKYEKEMRKKLQGPTEEIVNGTKVVRGFPVPFSQKLKGAETFLKPLTYAAFEFQPYDKISDHRLVHEHFWTGKDCDQKIPDEMNLVNTFPKPLQNQADLPKPIGFNNISQPSYVQIPNRHPGVIGSDLEALEKYPVIIPKVVPKTAAPAATGKQPAVGTTRRVQAPGRPNLERRTSDRGPKIKKAKASALGKKRATSAVHLTQYPVEKDSSEAQAIPITNKQAAAVPATDNPTAEDANFEDVDSPPSFLLATSVKDNQALLRTLRPSPPILKGVPTEVVATQPLPTSPSKQPLVAEIEHSASPQMPQPLPLTPPQSKTAPVPISQPATPPAMVSRSASVEKRDATLSDRSKRRVRWESNLVHTNEQGGFKPHSVYNYSKSPSPRYVHAESASSRPKAFKDSNTHVASKIGTAPKKRKNGLLIAGMANSLVRLRERLSRNGHGTEMPDFPDVPTHEASTLVNRGGEEEVEEEEDENEWEEEFDLLDKPTDAVATAKEPMMA